MLNKFKKYIDAVKIEGKKVSWLSRRETFMSSVSVFFIVCLFSIFFLLSDLLISNFINFILNI